MLRSILALALLLPLAAGCSSPNWRVTRQTLSGSEMLVAGGNLRLISARQRQVTHDDPSSKSEVVCTEPSPDVAVAFGRAASANASVATAAGLNVSGAGSFASTEAVSELAGRTAGVLALRDGLYVACQAYANGILGQSAYALILSEYGDLLVNLVGAPRPAGTKAADAAPPPGPGPTLTVYNGRVDAAAPRPPPTPEKAPVQAPPERPPSGALLVACIMEYDPSRLRGTPAPGGTGSSASNILLDRHFCQRVLQSHLGDTPRS